MIAEKVIAKNTCENFVIEIQKSKAFDDMIMGGRSRINKGSKNFKNFIKESKNANQLYKQFNNLNFYIFFLFCGEHIYKSFRCH